VTPTILTHAHVNERVETLALEVKRLSRVLPRLKVFHIPRGGVPVSYALSAKLGGLIEIVDDPEDATLFVDDIIDSGATLDRYATEYPSTRFVALVDKRTEPGIGWVVFPWENADAGGGIGDNIVRLLEFIGDNPKREGLKDTPARVAAAWKTWGAGYDADVAEVLRGEHGGSFADGGERYDEMVLVRDIPFYSHCEHHLAPFFGTADIAYIPQLNGRIVGLSKLSRLLDVFARRLQVQERLTVQVADALVEHLKPKGAAVTIRARHLCMESRGIGKQGHETVTRALRGVFKDDAAARAEFLGR
jgi:GTP cyclohydrolase I